MNTRQQAILYLTYLIVYSDGEYDDTEKKAVDYIRIKEGISDNDYQSFLVSTVGMSERELYDRGVDLIDECDAATKLSIFVWLYKISEVDGTVHAKEVRFLLYSLKRVGVDFDEVKKSAASFPAIPH